ncbi:MAG TPA: 5'-nucleotidase C-terminal domain-containing protein, partial [Acidobacteriota bacterium]|nr:5'-nucleotidase C-terminal domain-containing protein [Acidobacteriota bacterium]
MNRYRVRPASRPQPSLIPLILILAVALALAACGARQASAPPPAAAPAEAELVILHTNDHHGHPLKYDLPGCPGAGGLAARLTLVNGIRSRHANVLVLDAGDVNQGRPESNLFLGEPDFIGYNAIGYDAMALGNHEFDAARTVLMEQKAAARFPFLSANILTADGKPLVEPYLIRRFPGFTVAVLGLTTAETRTLALPRNIRDLTIADEVATARRYLPELRRKADVVVALVHLGISEDPGFGSRRLARECPEFDLIVDGHTHTFMDRPFYEGRVPIVQAWARGIVMGQATLRLRNRRVAGLEWQPLPVNVALTPGALFHDPKVAPPAERLVEDTALLTQMAEYGAKVDAMLAAVIGHAPATYRNNPGRAGGYSLGGLVCDALLWYTRTQGADFALMNRGSIRADLPEGPIPLKAVYAALPFDNTAVIVTLSGADVQALFDYTATIESFQGASPIVSAGVSAVLDHAARRARDIRINGQPLDPAATYRVVTNSFVAAGGDGYEVFKRGQLYDTTVYMREIFAAYIQESGASLVPDDRPRIILEGAPPPA